MSLANNFNGENYKKTAGGIIYPDPRIISATPIQIQHCWDTRNVQASSVSNVYHFPVPKVQSGAVDTQAVSAMKTDFNPVAIVHSIDLRASNKQFLMEGLGALYAGQEVAMRRNVGGGYPKGDEDPLTVARILSRGF